MTTERNDPEVFDFKTEADRLILACRFLADIDTAQLLRAINGAHAIGPIVDPTAYRNALQTGYMDDVARLAALAAPLISQFHSIKERLTTVGGILDA